MHIDHRLQSRDKAFRRRVKFPAINIKEGGLRFTRQLRKFVQKRRLANPAGAVDMEDIKGQFLGRQRLTKEITFGHPPHKAAAPRHFNPFA